MINSCIDSCFCFEVNFYSDNLSGTDNYSDSYISSFSDSYFSTFIYIEGISNSQSKNSRIRTGSNNCDFNIKGRSTTYF